MASRNGIIRWFAAVMAVIVILYGLLYIPTPYVVYKPGLAEDVGSMVKVDNADVAENSVFMLTTVRQMYPNWLSFIYARFHPEWDIHKKTDVFKKGETRHDYVERQLYIMQSSQSNAIQAAYKAAQIPYELTVEGVVVLQVISGMPAEGNLHVGDRIVAIDDTDVVRSEQVLELLRDKKVADVVKVRYSRNDKEADIELKMGDFSAVEIDEKQQPAASRPGLGISPADIIVVKSEDEGRQVRISVEDIGGPSAGLIFGLEIVDQLTPGDLTKGYRIAGTGEILPNGTVGMIGGEKFKVVAAEAAEAEVFFVPRGNYKEALKKAQEIHSAMQVVSVDTLEDAINYLDSLPDK